MEKTTRTIPKDAILIDVLSDSSFDEEHIKGARNFCVYEIAFLDKIQAAFPDKNQALCIYGWSDKTGEAKRAYYLLSKAGYNNVAILGGGLKAWKADGNKTEKESKLVMLEGDFVINPKESFVEWTGRKIGRKHVGTVSVKEGVFYLAANDFEGGEVILDMKSISDKDLEGEERQTLVNHLKSEDFFHVEEFPEAKLEFLEAEELLSVASKPNFSVRAVLTIKDIAKEISFEAFIHQKEGRVFLNAHFDIDRSDWDVRYGSEKFFSRLGIHIVDDMISFDLNLVAEKK